MKFVFLFLLFFYLFTGCSKEEQELNLLVPVPECVEVKIRENMDAAGQSFTSVERWSVAGAFHYDFIFAGCCDLGGFTYDKSCEITCTVFGLTGQRSEGCPEIPAPEDIVVVWQRE